MLLTRLQVKCVVNDFYSMGFTRNDNIKCKVMKNEILIDIFSFKFEFEFLKLTEKYN